MSWLFSQALVAEYSAGCCTGDEPSAQLNVMPTPHKFWRNDRTMDSSRLSQFGLTLQLLTEADGEALLTLFLAASHARTLAQPVQAQVSTESAADCGDTWRGSFAKYDRDTSKWKTAQCSLLGDSDEFLETWPRWGSMRNGASFLRPTPALPIFGNESGLWPTPTATLGAHGGRVTPRKSREGGTLIEAVSARSTWPTPRANDAEKRGNFDLENPRNGLPAAAKKWPTPCASASKGSSPASLTRKSGASRANDRIDHAVMASDGGQLNPEWVEWLMGWPIGWTGLKPLGMAKFQEWKQQHGESSPTTQAQAA
jgi:hypothetical protein